MYGMVKWWPKNIVTHCSLLVMEWALMRLPGIRIKQCHSQAVCHGMRHEWWDCNQAVSLTGCGHGMRWHEWWDCICKQHHSQAVGHGTRHGWWESSVTHILLVMGWEMIDETAIKQCYSLPVGHGMRRDWWDHNKAVSLTPCWSWDETWLMRLPGKEIKQCHSLPVGHGMRHDWWDCLAKK